MTTQDDFTAGKGLQQTGDFFSKSSLQSCSRSLCLEDVRLQRQCRCPGMLLGSGRHSVYKSRIHSADHETPEILASAAAILHAVQCHASVAVCCGSVPRSKPRYTALRGGSIDSNLQFCGSSWTTEGEASFQSVLTTQMKKQTNLWDGNGVGKPPHPRAISLPDVWVSKASVHDLNTGDGGDLSHISHQALTQDHQERASSAALETTQIKDKPKMRSMSDGLLASQRGLADCSNPQGVALKPAVSRSASQRLLVTSKPKPPIQNCLPFAEPSRMNNREKEHGENSTGCDDSEGNKELMSEGKGCKVSLLHLDRSGEDWKKALGMMLILLIPKASRSPDGIPSSAAAPFQNSWHLLFQEALKRRALDLILPVQHHVVPDVKSAECLCEPLPLITFTLIQAKETDHLMNPHLPSDDDLEDRNGKICVILCKSAWKKIEEKQTRAMELLCSKREKKGEDEKSLHLPALSINPGDAAKETNCLPADALDCRDWEEKTNYEDTQEARPFPRLQQALLQRLAWLSSGDWQQQMNGLLSVRCLAVCHSEVLLSRLPDVSLAVIKEIRALCLIVSRFAMIILQVLFRTMKKHMKHMVGEVTPVLLQKMGDSSEFIQKTASQSLTFMVENVTPARAMTALMANGVQHRNVLVQKCAAEHLLTVMEQIGAEKHLSGTRDNTTLLVHTLVKLAQDCHQDARCFGRKMLNLLMSNQKFVKYLKHSVPSRDLEEVMATIKQKGVDLGKHEPPSAKVTKKSRNSRLRMPQDNLPSAGRLRSDSDVQSALPRPTVRHTPFRTMEETDQLNEICSLLNAKDFQICDDFVPRLQDSNRTVNQQELEVLALMTSVLNGALHPVLFPLVPAVTDNLNSKHLGIYTAAVEVLEAPVAHLDNTLLLQVLASYVQFLSGQALLDVTEHVSVLVASVYSWRPHVVEHYVLPLLWFFLGKKDVPVRSSTVRAVFVKHVKSLYGVLGHRLKKHAMRQPLRVVANCFSVFNLNVR
ncbi:TOG array regulator of axonemal microtubules protein 2 [Rhynochetos jubatus]